MLLHEFRQYLVLELDLGFEGFYTSLIPTTSLALP
jgi:hypothetical protein